MNYLDITKLYKSITDALNKGKHEGKLPSNCYFLKGDAILALDNLRGDARHPYTRDGLTLWAYSSGYITINESNFYIIPMTLEGKEPYLAFFGGLLNKDNKYDYFSLSGVADTSLGREKVEKYTIFNPTSVVYLRVYKKIIYSLEISLTEKKEVIASINIVNASNKEVDIYSSAFVNALLTHSNYESEETKWFRRCSLKPFGATFYSVEDVSRDVHLYNYAVIHRYTEENVSATSTRMLYVGNKNGQLATSTCLHNGKLVEEKEVSQFIDSAVYGDIIKKHLLPKENLEVHYRLSVAFNEEDAYKLEQLPYEKEYNNQCLVKLKEEHDTRLKNNKNVLKLEINGLSNVDIDDKTFNNFIKKVIVQVDYCSRAKNSSLMMLGIRDIAQMLEAMVMWNPTYVKEKLLYVFNYVEDTGRLPRQASQFDNEGGLLIDSREFIDQGQWLISLVYKYLCYTNDYSILNEKVGYIHIDGSRHAHKIDKVDTLFDHLKLMMNYFINNIDNDTGCLRTLFGDWNDAVDGLGSPLDGSTRYGNGVSIMASFHMYMNLKEFADICKIKGQDNSLYLKTRESLFKSIRKYGVVSKDGENRIVHGWGQDRRFYVGSFDDVDHKSRHSSTSNSFYVISGYYQDDKSLKETVLDAYRHLDSKYGLMTFDVPFDKDDASLVGRIVNLPKGTAENAATYIHAAMYAVKALGMLNEGEFAYQQLMKIIPLTHTEISTSPFVMPNSYGYNPKLGIDGQSMNDWYTGSSNTLLKALVDSIIGVIPQIDNKIVLKPIKFPVNSMKLEITIKKRRIKLMYHNRGNNKPQIKVDGLINNGLIDLDNNKNKTINIEIDY